MGWAGMHLCCRCDVYMCVSKEGEGPGGCAYCGGQTILTIAAYD